MLQYVQLSKSTVEFLQQSTVHEGNWERNLGGCSPVRFLSHFVYSWDFHLLWVFGTDIWRGLIGWFSPHHRQWVPCCLSLLLSWFVLTVMLGDLCTRAERAGTKRYVSKFQLQIAFSKTPNFYVLGFWEKLGFLWLKELLMHSSDRVHPWCNILLGHFRGCLHDNDILHFTKFLGCTWDVLLVLTVCPC